MSETDTEVVAQLLDCYYSQCGDMFEAVNQMLYAGWRGPMPWASSAPTTPDRLIAARKDAPLLLGYGEGENFIASDVTAIIRHTRDVVYMDDGELAVLTADGIRVYDERSCAHREGAPPCGLGCGRRGKGRLRPLHAQGDHGAARGHPQGHRRPHPGTAGWCCEDLTMTTE